MNKTITLSAPRSYALPKLRTAIAKSLTKLFSERVSIVISSVGAAASFFMAVADHPRACALTVAVILPWFIKSLQAKEGGSHARI